MVTTTDDWKVQRPWTALAAAATAAHHSFELSNGIGLVWQPELGLARERVVGNGDSDLDRTRRQRRQTLGQSARRGSGANIASVLVHFLLWPSRRSRLGLPILTEAEGLNASRLPAYNTLLYFWAAASALSIVREISPRDRRWALVGFAALPLMRQSAKHHFSWLTQQAATNPAWWNRGVQHD